MPYQGLATHNLQRHLPSYQQFNVNKNRSRNGRQRMPKENEKEKETNKEEKARKT